MPNNYPQPTQYLRSGLPQTENRSSTIYPGQIGQRFILEDKSDSNKAKAWQVVQLDSVMSTLPYAGAVAWWANRARYLVTTSPSTAGQGNVAGVFATSAVAADVTAQNIMCVQQGGRASVNFIDSPVSAPTAAGLFVIPSSTDAKADCLAAGTAATYPKLGVSIGTATAHFADVDLSVTDDVNP